MPSATSANNSTVIVDGQMDWSGGVSSQRVTTMRSELVPNGLARNQLAWLINGSVRDGGVSPRMGWNDMGQAHPGAMLFQIAYLYHPQDGSTPYFVACIGGRIWQLYADNVAGATDLSAAFGLSFPAGIERAYFCQGEEFLVIQSGLPTVLPLFWDGTTLRQSNGITGNTDPTLGPINEIPSATCMEYFMGRLWYAQGRIYTAGDIVKGANGTLAYGFRDAILKVTENPLAIGGDGFSVPTYAGNIRALKASASINTALGQGLLYIFTRKSVYSLDVPVTRTDWINARQPFQKVVQTSNGAVSDLSVVDVNSDLFFQSLEPGIRSLMMAVRYFGQWSNPPISSNMNRVLKANNRALLRAGSGIHFDERMYQTALPKMTQVGIVHQALAVMDFNPLGSLESQLPPVWEGIYEGLQILQLAVGDYGGRERAFAWVLSKDSTIHVWELTDYALFETDDKRIEMAIEFPAFTWSKESVLKKLVGGELWIDRLYGETWFEVYYRPDGDACWHLWTEFKECTARNSGEDYWSPTDYPSTEYGEGYRNVISLPLPQPECAVQMMRPTNEGFQFQVRLIVKGRARVRGLVLFAEPMVKRLYGSLPPTRLQQTFARQLA